MIAILSTFRVTMLAILGTISSKQENVFDDETV